MSDTCAQCEGSGFLNAELIPDAILNCDPREFRIRTINWILAQDECQVEVCPRCLHEDLADHSRIIRNRIFQRGGLEALREFEQRLRTCRACGHISQWESSECPVCGKLRIGGMNV